MLAFLGSHPQGKRPWERKSYQYCKEKARDTRFVRMVVNSEERKSVVKNQLDSALISVWRGECGRLYRNTKVSLGSNQATAPDMCRKVRLVQQKDHSRSLSPAPNLAPDIRTSPDPLSWMTVKLGATLEALTRWHPVPGQSITSFIDPTLASPGLCKWNNLLGQRYTGVLRAVSYMSDWPS